MIGRQGQGLGQLDAGVFEALSGVRPRVAQHGVALRAHVDGLGPRRALPLEEARTKRREAHPHRHEEAQGHPHGDADATPSRRHEPQALGRGRLGGVLVGGQVVADVARRAGANLVELHPRGWADGHFATTFDRGLWRVEAGWGWFGGEGGHPRQVGRQPRRRRNLQSPRGGAEGVAARCRRARGRCGCGRCGRRRGRTLAQRAQRCRRAHRRGLRGGRAQAGWRGGAYGARRAGRERALRRAERAERRGGRAQGLYAHRRQRALRTRRRNGCPPRKGGLGGRRRAERPERARRERALVGRWTRAGPRRHLRVAAVGGDKKRVELGDGPEGLPSLAGTADLVHLADPPLHDPLLEHGQRIKRDHRAVGAAQIPRARQLLRRRLGGPVDLELMPTARALDRRAALGKQGIVKLVLGRAAFADDVHAPSRMPASACGAHPTRLSRRVSILRAVVTGVGCAPIGPLDGFVGVHAGAVTVASRSLCPRGFTGGRGHPVVCAASGRRREPPGLRHGRCCVTAATDNTPPRVGGFVFGWFLWEASRCAIQSSRFEL
jgi:hypothetical protein